VYQASEKLKSVGARAPHKKQKFDTPAMDARGLGAVFSSAAIQLRLLRPLSDSEVLGVSLNLFKKLSIIFEIQQEWTDILTGSAFSEEDLPSNLISFYRAAKGYDRNQINQYCHAWNQVDSLKEYNRDHDFKKNFDFTSVAAKGQWPKELANIDDGNMSNLYEISAISTTQGSDNFYFCPVYRVGRRLGGSDLFITHIGGKDFTFSDNLLVIPTYRARFGTSGQFGHVQFTEVKPYKQRDISLFKRYKIPSPIYVPAPILACLGG
jgi:hypothetical protein